VEDEVQRPALSVPGDEAQRPASSVGLGVGRPQAKPPQSPKRKQSSRRE
jgi:hypothetical protein